MRKSSIYTGIFTLLLISLINNGCNYISHRTYSRSNANQGEDAEPDYNVSLTENYQDFVSYIFMGNRAENFSAFFNKFYSALEDYDEAMEEYKTSTIATYNRNLDSLNIMPVISQTGKDKLLKVIERCSKIIQFNKNTRLLDDAVLLIGKSYYYLGDYYQAERKFAEFLSKLSISPLTSEALLYLGMTKFHIDKPEEGEMILNNLLKTSGDAEIKSEAAEELGKYELSKKNFEEAIKYYNTSISLTKDRESKAEKYYILGKIISINKPSKAYIEYKKAIDLTSDFDLTFYSQLNYAKSLSYNKDYLTSYKILDKLDSKYRDYPELKQFAELEMANNLYSQKKTKTAKIKYFEIIINYPGSLVAADAYYYLAKHYETVEKSYLNALINYRKVSETNGGSDYARISSKIAETYEKYFTYLAEATDTVKTEIPSINKELERYRKKYEEEKGIERDKEPGREEKEGEIKGGGWRFYRAENFNSGYLDSLKSNELIDTLIEKNIGDSLEVSKNLDSLINAKSLKKLNAYYQIAELFLYELNRPDSAEFYFSRILTTANREEIVPKTMYSLAALYKTQNRNSEAENLYKKITEEFPYTQFANESRKILGLPKLEIETDHGETIYAEAENKFELQDYRQAETLFKNIYEKYPESKYASKSLFALGWLYENVFLNKDSMLYFYNKLKDSYPSSEYASAISKTLEIYTPQEKVETDTLQTLIEDSTKTGYDTLMNKDTTSIKEEEKKPGDGTEKEEIKDEKKEKLNPEGEVKKPGD